MDCLMWSLWYKYCCISSVRGVVVEKLEKGVTFVSTSGVRTFPCAEHLPLWALSPFDNLWLPDCNEVARSDI